MDRLTKRTLNGIAYMAVADTLSKRDQEIEGSKPILEGLYTIFQKLADYEDSLEAKPIEKWGEDYGDCLWWKFPIEEPPYCGSPLDCDFPDYVTHFTRLIMPLDIK